MSTFRNPVGPQPASVYWRRRLVVALLLIAVIAIVVLIIVQPRGDSKSDSGNKQPHPQVSQSVDPSAACAPGVVELTASTDKSNYASGENPQMTLTLTNEGAVPCTINAGTTQQVFTITSGSETYWKSTDCQSGAVDANVVLEPNIPKSTNPLAWDRTRSSPTTCDSSRQQVTAGGASYHLVITLGDLESNDVQFLLN